MAAGLQRILGALSSWRTALTDRPVSLYAASVLRIGYGLAYLAFLLREFPHRQEIWGPDSPWTPALANELFVQTGWSSILTLSLAPLYFEACYVLALVTCLLFLLGWRTRVISLVFAVVVASFHARTIFMTDGGDNLILLMSMYLCFTACGRRWSLDARRLRLRAEADGAGAAKTGAESTLMHQLQFTRTQLVTLLHNCGMLVIAAQVCLLYGSAGLYKVQGNFWGNGTALHYVLNLDLFRPWPALSILVDHQAMFIAVAGYLTVLLQVALPCVLFSKVKYVVLPLLLGMHAGIAVLMGLPLFSAAMIIADAVFLPDRFYLYLARHLRRLRHRKASRKPGDPDRAGTSHVPAQAQPRPATGTGAVRPSGIGSQSPRSVSGLLTSQVSRVMWSVRRRLRGAGDGIQSARDDDQSVRPRRRFAGR
ncbi:HTTM domain-containing protein [Streptomyces celluloflavus]|nr:HTTM domain-containing protein [Streptomyces celluloflavus]